MSEALDLAMLEAAKASHRPELCSGSWRAMTRYSFFAWNEAIWLQPILDEPWDKTFSIFDAINGGNNYAQGK
jgi:hypothetical protein